MLIAAILVCGFGFSLASAQDVPITDVKIFAGTWEGYLRGDGGMSSRLTMTVQEDGTYRVQGPGVDAGAGGTITVKDGKATYQAMRSSGTVTMLKDGTIRFEGSGSRGSGSAEWTKK